MPRPFGSTLLLAGVLLVGLTGCPRQTPVTGEDAATLVLILPESRTPPEHRPERVPKLTVNGKAEEVKPGAKSELTVKVPPADGLKTITIVYDFWPKSYSNTIRTKEVKFEGGKTVRVDFNQPDKDRRDDIKPIFYPTPHAVVDLMCELGEVSKNDIVYDIGCGDGRMVITGVKKFGAKKGVGVDIDLKLIKQCNEAAAKEGVSDRVEFRVQDALKINDLSDATVVLLYVGEDFGKALEPVLRKTLKSGARVVSHRFPLGEWKADVEKTVTAKNNDGDDEEYELKLWKIK